MDKIKLPRCLLGAGTNDLNTDKGEVGGSSPPRPTIHQSPVLTFLLSADLLQNPFCQLLEQSEAATSVHSEAAQPL
jgi:hypothetical protein